MAFPPIPEPPVRMCCEAPTNCTGTEFSRCSTCKNRFYCSAQCQKADWKKHKFACSPLHPAPATVAYTQEQLSEQVESLDAQLQKIREGIKDQNITPTAKAHVGKLLLDYEVPPSLQFDHGAGGGARYPYRNPLNTITRIIHLHQVGAMTPEQKDKYIRVWAGVSFPTYVPKLYGPKMVVYPGQLAPAEYQALTNSAGFANVDPDTMGLLASMEVAKRWETMAMIDREFRNFTGQVAVPAA